MARQRSNLPDCITSGRYEDETGQPVPAQSGKGPESPQIARHLFEAGILRRPGMPFVAMHVEPKVAWRMRTSGQATIELVINNKVCRGDLSCRKPVEDILLRRTDPGGARPHRGPTTGVRGKEPAVNAALNTWYYRDDDHGTGDEPQLVTTPEELDRVMDHILDHPQPHPPVITVRDRPRLMGGRYPDHEVKIDADRHAGIGAILCSGPPDFAPDATTTDEHGGAWITLTQTDLPEDTPALYMDKATKTEFPHNAVVPLESWRKALHELLQTGKRPACARWQDTDIH